MQNFVEAAIAGSLVPLLVDLVKPERLKDWQKAALATIIAIGANIAIVFVFSQVLFDKIYHRFGVSDKWLELILKNLGKLRDYLLGPPPTPPGWTSTKPTIDPSLTVSCRNENAREDPYGVKKPTCPKAPKAIGE